MPPPNRNPAKPRLAVVPVDEAKTDGGPTGVIPAAANPDNILTPEPAISPVRVVADTSPTPPPADVTEPILPELVENPTTPAVPAPTTDPAATLAGVETARTAVLAAPLPEAETVTDPTLVTGLDTPPAAGSSRRAGRPATRSAPPNPNATADDLAPAKPVAPPNPNAATPTPAPAPTKPNAAADDAKPSPAAMPDADKPADPNPGKPADDAKAETDKEPPAAALPPTPAVPVVTPSPVNQSDVLADPFPAALNAPQANVSPATPSAKSGTGHCHARCAEQNHSRRAGLPRQQSHAGRTEQGDPGGGSRRRPSLRAGQCDAATRSLGKT